MNLTLCSFLDEVNVFENSRKMEIIKELENNTHDYLSMMVCRNPVDKLLSVYNVMKDPRQGFVKGEELFSFCYLTSSHSFNLQIKN